MIPIGAGAGAFVISVFFSSIVIQAIASTPPLSPLAEEPNFHSTEFESPTTEPTITPASPTPEPTIDPSPSATPKPSTTPKPSATPVHSVSPTPSPTVTPALLDDWFTKYSNEQSVNRDLLKKIAVCESKLNPNAKNGDYGGMFQFATQTWKTTRQRMNKDSNPKLRFDAEQAILTAAFYLATLKDRAWPNCR